MTVLYASVAGSREDPVHTHARTHERTHTHTHHTHTHTHTHTHSKNGIMGLEGKRRAGDEGQAKETQRTAKRRQPRALPGLGLGLDFSLEESKAQASKGSSTRCQPVPKAF